MRPEEDNPGVVNKPPGRRVSVCVNISLRAKALAPLSGKPSPLRMGTPDTASPFPDGAWLPTGVS